MALMTGRLAVMWTPSLCGAPPERTSKQMSAFFAANHQKTSVIVYCLKNACFWAVTHVLHVFVTRIIRSIPRGCQVCFWCPDQPCVIIRNVADSTGGTRYWIIPLKSSSQFPHSETTSKLHTNLKSTWQTPQSYPQQRFPQQRLPDTTTSTTWPTITPKLKSSPTLSHDWRRHVSLIAASADPLTPHIPPPLFSQLVFRTSLWRQGDGSIFVDFRIRYCLFINFRITILSYL